MLPRPVLASFLTASALLAGAPAAARAQDDAPGPCASQALRCPDLTMRAPYGLEERRGPSGKLLLAATNAIVNVGDGPAELKATRIGDSKVMRARQVIRARGSAPARVLEPTAHVDFFDTGTRGVYWKWRHAIRFELRRQRADGSLGSVASRSPKIYSCLRDLRRVQQLLGGGSYPGSPLGAHFGACSTDPADRAVTLGTSVGWADIYPFGYPQNSLAVDGLRGCFVYEHTVDPLDELQELDETNNTGRTVVRLPWRGAGRRGCPALDA